MRQDEANADAWWDNLPAVRRVQVRHWITQRGKQPPEEVPGQLELVPVEGGREDEEMTKTDQDVAGVRTVAARPIGGVS